MLDFLKILDNIKKIENIKLDKDIAKTLGLKNDNFSRYKNKNIVPIKNIVDYCLEKNLSIDEVLNTKKSVKDKFIKNDNVTIKFLDENESLSLPSKFFKNIELINIYAYSNNETEIFLIDTLTTTYTSASNYLLFNSKENKKQISFLNFENEKFTILADKKFNNLTFNEFNETFKIIGKVVQKITSNIDPKK